VIANHALVMIQAAMGGLDDGNAPRLRYVFDEGHHLFDAADGAFGAHLSGVEASDLRRWILGAEGRRGSRARGLERRLSDLFGRRRRGPDRPSAGCSHLAQLLPSPNWQTRLADGTVLGPAEEFSGSGAPAGTRPEPRATIRASARNATCGRSIPACSRPPTG